jgi:flagellar basal-body rod protein FlgC
MCSIALMMTAISTARSAMLASLARLDASASNIANASTTGPLPPASAGQPNADPPEGAPRVYQPVDVVLKSIGDQNGPAGVAVGYRPRLPAYVRQHEPSAPFADADRIVAAPNVDLAQEAVGVLEASLLFKANLAVLKKADEMTRSVLDATA